MAKVSELSLEQLEKFKTKFQNNLNSNIDVENSTKKLNAINKEIANRNHNDQTVTQFHIPKDLKTESQNNLENASFIERAIALIIDSAILFFASLIIGFILGGISGIFGNSTIAGLIIMLQVIINIFLPLAYFIFFYMKQDGQSPGKKIMKIKVVSTDENEQDLTLRQTILRESLGKFVSGILLGLGYLVMLFGYKAWHDKLFDTNVVKLQS